MQFFPAVNPTNTSTGTAGFSLGTGMQNTEFDSVLASFIQEDRYDYSGRPAGFSAHVTEQGTLDSDTVDSFKKELEKRKVDAETIARLEELALSDTPMTVATAFGALSGKGRSTEALEGEERDAFKALLGKLGFSKEEQEEMLGLSDDGNRAAMRQRLSGKLNSLEDSADITAKEWKALLNGLDLSSGTQKNLLALFGDAEELALTGAELKTMLSQMDREYALRDAAAQHAQSQMRDAMDAALKSSKVKEQSGPVENLRGSRRSDQSEALMQNSVRKNTGVDNLKQELTDEDSGFEDKKDGRSRSERILATDDDLRAAPKARTAGTDGTRPIDTFFQRIDAAVSQAAPQPAAQPASAQNLNSMAKDFRGEIFSQVEKGILQSAQNGTQNLTLQLAPAELGRITVVLSLQQGEMKATIRAEQPESADVLREQMAELKTSLEEQGIKVKELDVQTGLQDRADQDRWDGHREHNLMHDQTERDRAMRLTRLRREAGTGNTVNLEATQRATTDTGLHIVA